jgi:hypothetical protein
MPVDPLSPATRTTKRNLLVASVLAITYKAFNVTIDKIPVAGLSINFDNRVFTFLLLVTLLYFLLTFVLYFFIDIRDIETTAHQTASETLFRDALHSFVLKYEDRLAKEVKEGFPDYDVTSSRIAGALAGQLATGDYPKISKNPGQRKIILDDYAEPKPEPDPVFINAAQRMLRRYRFWYWAKYASLLPRRYSIRLTYFIRNYLTDGVLPIALGCFAIIALYGKVGVQWIQLIAPAQN